MGNLEPPAYRLGAFLFGVSGVPHEYRKCHKSVVYDTTYKGEDVICLLHSK